MSQSHQRKPLWICPQCGRQFANQNQSHACVHYTLAEHLEGTSPEVLALYHRLEAVIHRLGPVIVNPEKTRIAF
jgi:transposase-like protein